MINIMKTNRADERTGGEGCSLGQVSYGDGICMRSGGQTWVTGKDIQEEAVGNAPEAAAGLVCSGNSIPAGVAGEE